MCFDYPICLMSFLNYYFVTVNLFILLFVVCACINGVSCLCWRLQSVVSVYPKHCENCVKQMKLKDSKCTFA